MRSAHRQCTVKKRLAQAFELYERGRSIWLCRNSKCSVEKEAINKQYEDNKFGKISICKADDRWMMSVCNRTEAPGNGQHLDINKQFTEEQLIDKHVKMFHQKPRGNADSGTADPGLHPRHWHYRWAWRACEHEEAGTPLTRWWQKGESSHHLGKQSEKTADMMKKTTGCQFPEE